MVVASRALLLRLGAPALAAAILTSVAVTQIPEMNPLRLFLASLPLFILTAWFLGAAVRHWLLGETPANPIDPPAERRALLQVSVITYILWKALVAVYEQTLVHLADPETLMADPARLQEQPGAQLLLMIMMGVLFWALRFRLLPVLAAVGYPLRDYIIRANSFMLSLRMLGLVLVCVEFPKALILATLFTGGTTGVVLVTVQHILTLILEVWLFAAFVVALRQMLGKAA